MTDFILHGPWPRKLTTDEIDEIKARAMIKIGEMVEKELPKMVLDLSDQVHFTYTVGSGTDAEIKGMMCGAIPPNGGPLCRLNKNHVCEHSSVVRWK